MQNAEQTVFLTNIAKFKPVICSIVSPFSDEFKPITPVDNLPPCLQDLYQAHNEELTYSELIAVCEQTKLSITEEEVATIEAATRNQSKNMAWFNQRAGRITASVMKSVCATDPGNPAQNLIQCICYPDKNKFFSEAKKWGCEHESSAKTAYINIMKASVTENLFVKTADLLLVQPTHSLVQVQMAVYIVNVVDQGCLSMRSNVHIVFALMNLLVLPTWLMANFAEITCIFIKCRHSSMCTLQITHILWWLHFLVR